MKPPTPQTSSILSSTSVEAISSTAGVLPVLPAAIDSDRDARAVIRRMRIHSKAAQDTLSTKSFNQLVAAAKDDVVADEAAAKNELQYYRNLLDITQEKPRKTITPPTQLKAPLVTSTVKLPSLNEAKKQFRPPPTSNQQERPPSRHSTKPIVVAKKLSQVENKKEEAVVRPKSSLKPEALAPIQLKAKKQSIAPKQFKGAPKKSSTTESNNQGQESTVTNFTKPLKSKAATSAIDCLASFDDDEPEMDSAPVWADDFGRGYGSDDNM